MSLNSLQNTIKKHSKSVAKSEMPIENATVHSHPLSVNKGKSVKKSTRKISLKSQKALQSNLQSTSSGTVELDSNEEQPAPLESVVSQLNKLSQSFVDSYQSLEGKVEKLNDELQNESELKQSALNEKEQILDEKIRISDRLQNLLSILPAGVIVLDGEGRVRDCNAMATDLLGRPLLNELWIEVIQRAFQPQADDGHQISLKDGRKIHIETKALDTEPGQLIVLTDMTKTRELQAQLSQQHKLSSMGKMVAFLAHQIRTPLSTAILYGSQLKEKTIDSTMRDKFSDHLLERLNFMERQITDMLNFVKGERKVKQPVSIIELYEKIKQANSDKHEQVEFQLEEIQINKKTANENAQPLAIMADLDALEGAINNLIENACQSKLFGTEGDKAEVKVLFRIGNSLQIEVEDNGKGISTDKIPHIFEPFFTEKKNGNGLGLAVVHGVVIDHGGKIKVDSVVNEWTRFSVDLPIVDLRKNSAQIFEATDSVRKGELV